MVIVAQSVRASDCGSEGRGFESHLSPNFKKPVLFRGWFFFVNILKLPGVIEMLKSYHFLNLNAASLSTICVCQSKQLFKYSL